MDCVFAVTDVMALGALAALRDAGLRVPEDVGVAGFDDVPSLRDVVPLRSPPSRLPMVGMGTAAVELALDGEARRAPGGSRCAVRSSCDTAPHADALLVEGLNVRPDGRDTASASRAPVRPARSTTVAEDAYQNQSRWRSH